MRRFKWQIFISFNLLFTFLVMLVSGIILYFKPEGSVARWLSWEIWGLTKSGWEALHTVFSFLFLIFAVIHILKINYTIIKLYFLNSRRKSTIRELSVALLISVVFLIGTVYNIPPFHSIFKAGNYLSDSWTNQVEIKHEAIEVKQTMREVAFEMGLDESKLLSMLENKYGYNVSLSKSLQQNAAQNDLTPYELYNHIRSGKKSLIKDQTDKVFGNITLEEMAAILDIQTSRLITATKDLHAIEDINQKTTIEYIAQKTDQPPEDVKESIVRQVNHLLSLPEPE